MASDIFVHSLREAQEKLAQLKYYHGAVDGLDGPLTRNAVRAFQINVHLIPSGVYTEATDVRLFPIEGKQPSIIGGILTLIFSGDKGMGRYSKLIAAIIGGVVGTFFVYLTSKGLGVCTTIGDPSSCTVLGIPETAFEGGLVTLITGLLVYLFPANKPPA